MQENDGYYTRGVIDSKQGVRTIYKGRGLHYTAGNGHFTRLGWMLYRRQWTDTNRREGEDITEWGDRDYTMGGIHDGGGHNTRGMGTTKCGEGQYMIGGTVTTQWGMDT